VHYDKIRLFNEVNMELGYRRCRSSHPVKLRTMKKKTFDAVAFTREIRDAHHEQLKDATPEERIRFYQEKARLVHEELGVPAPGSEVPAASR
jgi:hypothetical protein